MPSARSFGLFCCIAAWPAYRIGKPLAFRYLSQESGEAVTLARALAHVGVVQEAGVLADVRPHSKSEHGTNFCVTLPPRCSMDDLRRTEGTWLPITGAMSVRYAHTSSTRDDRPRVLVSLMTSDPLAVPPSGFWPECPNPAAPPARLATDVWPLGVTEDGSLLSLGLAPGGNSSLLIGGSPGSGKSVIHAPIAACAMDPNAELFLIDLKGGVELNCWSSRANAVAFQHDEATDLLERLVLLMEDRLTSLRMAGLRRAELGPTWPPVLLAIDECAELLRGPDALRCARAGDALTSLAARGRAAGVFIVLATQKPTSDSLPTAVRDLMGYRLCLRTGTRDQAVAVLGPEGFDPDRSPCAIPLTSPGLGYLLDEKASLRRVRCFWMPDEYLDALGASTAAARQAALESGAAVALTLPPAPVKEPKLPRGNRRRGEPAD